MEAGIITYYPQRGAQSGKETGDFRADYATLFWLFMFGSVAGFVLEGLWCVITDGHWESHTATVWGPFCIIYGIGAVAVCLLSGLLRWKSLPVQFAAFSASGAAVEFFGSLFQELCFGSVSWDYSGHLLNLGGRVSLKMALMWGVLGIVFIRLAFLLVRRALGKPEPPCVLLDFNVLPAGAPRAGEAPRARRAHCLPRAERVHGGQPRRDRRRPLPLALPRRRPRRRRCGTVAGRALRRRDHGEALPELELHLKY